MAHVRDQHDGGLAQDLALLARHTDRRTLLRLLGAASLAPLLGCTAQAATPRPASADSGPGPADAAPSPDVAAAADTQDIAAADAQDAAAVDTQVASCKPIPAETAGPFPGDGSIGPSALALSGIVRSDIRSSLAPLSGMAQGVPLTVELRLVDSQHGCAPLAGYAVYLWHCDRDGEYSMYTLPSQNYLRGVQAADASGTLTFRTIFPGCYPGRWPHMHFEVYPSLTDAAAANHLLRTSQLALPKDACDAVYASTGYAASAGYLAKISLETDGVFADGASLQVAAVTGSVAGGLLARLVVGV